MASRLWEQEITSELNSFDAAVFGDRYCVKERELLGVGTFGLVFAAFDKVDGRKVAIKKLKLVERNTESLIPITQLKRISRELYILKRVKHRSVVQLVDLLKGTSSANQNLAIYIVMNYMPTDLHQVIWRGRDQLTSKHIQWLFYCLICGLRYLHSANVTHRDLKPQNILIDESCNLNICDFGLARIFSEREQENGSLTQMVTALCYRAPEVMLSPGRYSNAIDMWSAGCILAEMLTGKPLFAPAHHGYWSPWNHLQCILNVFGTESNEEPAEIKELCGLLKKPPSRKQPWKEIVGVQDKNVYNLLDELLVFSPEYRLTADAALNHTYFDGIRGLSDESLCTTPFTAHSTDFVASSSTLLECVLNEIEEFQNSKKPTKPPESC